MRPLEITANQTEKCYYREEQELRTCTLWSTTLESQACIGGVKGHIQMFYRQIFAHLLGM